METPPRDGGKFPRGSSSPPSLSPAPSAAPTTGRPSSSTITTPPTPFSPPSSPAPAACRADAAAGGAAPMEKGTTSSRGFSTAPPGLRRVSAWSAKLMEQLGVVWWGWGCGCMGVVMCMGCVYLYYGSFLLLSVLVIHLVGTSEWIGDYLRKDHYYVQSLYILTK